MDNHTELAEQYGKLFLLNEIITILETKKREVKKDIERDSKFPDPYLDKL